MRAMHGCPNYRCRRPVENPDIFEIPSGWTSVVCPHCHCVLALYSRDRALDGFGSIPPLVEPLVADEELIGLPVAAAG